MAIRKKYIRTQREIVIDISGPQGNAYHLLGTARNLSKQLGLNTNEVIQEMHSGDYDNLIRVFDEYFGELVTLEY